MTICYENDVTSQSKVEKTRINDANKSSARLTREQTTTTGGNMKAHFRKPLAALGFAALLFTACGGDDSSSTATEAPASSEAPSSEAPSTDVASTDAPAGDVSALDTNGDGVVQFALAIPGPANDGAYYQALVDGVKAFTTSNGLPDPIIVDKIEADKAATAMDDLAQQGVDVIAVGASEIAGPLADLTVKYPDIFWYCNCGAGFADLPGLAQTLDDSSQISYSAGYATGLLLKAAGNSKATFLGCCDLGFEKEAYLSFELGLKAVLPDAEFSYVKTGSYDYDFDNTAGATEAYNAAKAAGVGAVYPYLGGAHEPIVQLANADGIITMSAGSSTACDRTDLKYDIAVKFDGGDYILEALARIVAGTFKEGEKLVYNIGDNAGPGGSPGAVICNPTPEQQTAMDAIDASLAAGEFAADLGAIKGQAYGG
jgi:basic membrane protein A